MLTSQFVDVNARSESKLHLTSVSPCALYVLASPEFYKVLLCGYVLYIACSS